jgi:hypothetical protein
LEVEFAPELEVDTAEVPSVDDVLVAPVLPTPIDWSAEKIADMRAPIASGGGAAVLVVPPLEVVPWL